MLENQHLYEKRYLSEKIERLHSYNFQITETVSRSPETVALIGVGDKIVCNILRSIGIPVCGIDLDPQLSPDLCCSVTSISAEDNSFDLSICCQVLEHLPFDEFVPALKELRRITRRYLVLSLPDMRHFFTFRVRVPRTKTMSLNFSLPRLRGRTFPVDEKKSIGHHWEIGYSGYEFDKVTSSIMASGWNILKTFRVSDYFYHTFFICTKGM